MTDNPRIEDLRRRVQKDPASIAFAQLAEEYRRAGQSTEAIEVCRTGLAIHPGYLSARVTLGRALLELGELDAARQELRDGARRRAPENLAAIRGLAEIHPARRPAEALGQYQGPCRLAPNDPDLEDTVGDLTTPGRSERSDAPRTPAPTSPPPPRHNPRTPSRTAPRAR